MYNLVPPKTKLVDCETPYLKDVVFKVKILDFIEDDLFSGLLLKNAKTENEEFVKDEKGNYIINEEQYYIDCFKLFVKEIQGIEGDFSPSWKVIKSVVNKAIAINSASDFDLGK